jgi:menaquinone-dependent protoporphyrinogen oxidase
MKTLILYGTHGGCTRACAERLVKELGDAKALDAAKASGSDLDGFDTVVLGSSIWAGKIHPKMRKFVARNLDALASRRVGMYICSGEDRSDHIAANYPPRLVERASVKANFGGALDIKTLSPIMRLMMKLVAGVTESYDRLKPDAITRFAAEMRGR